MTPIWNGLVSPALINLVYNLMGVERYAVELLATARNNGCPFDKFATLGRQNIFLRPHEIERIESEWGIKVSDVVVPGNDSGIADEVFKRFGANTLHSIDYSDYEGCSVVLDLNAQISQEQEEQYDAVFDGGTLEHVFHFPNAISNCMKLLREGGWFFSVTGSNNWNGHGFYQFSPELFYRVFSKENGFEVKIMALGESPDKGKLYRVEDGADLGHRVQMNGKCPLILIFAAKRVSVNVEIFKSMPYQSDYSVSWEAAETETEDPIRKGVSESVSRSLASRIKSKIGALVRRINPPLPPGITEVEKLADCAR